MSDEAVMRRKKSQTAVNLVLTPYREPSKIPDERKIRCREEIFMAQGNSRRSFADLAIVFLAVFMAGLPARAQAPQAAGPIPNRFSHLTIQEGLSQGSAMTILQDRRGFLWIGTEDGLNRYDGADFKIYRPSESPNSICHQWVRTLCLDRGGVLWVGTMNGLNRYNEETDDFTRFQNNSSDSQSLSSNAVASILEDDAGVLWVATEGGGLNAFDRETGKCRIYRHDPQNPKSLSHDSVFAIAPGKEGELWLATQGGLNRFDPKTGEFRAFFHNSRDPSSLSSDLVRAVLEDRQGRLWVGTEGGGLNVLDRASGRFRRYRNDPARPDSLSHDNVYAIFQDAVGRILVGTLEGISQFEEQRGVFSVLRNDRADLDSLSYDYVVSFFQDRTGILWIGTRGRGLDKFAPEGRRFELYENRPDDPNSLSSAYVRAIAEDGAGRLWIGTEDKGLDLLDRKTGRIEHFRHDPRRPTGLSSNNVYALAVDPAGFVWIGTAGGGLNRLDPRTKTFLSFRHSPNDAGSLSHNSVRSLCLDRRGRLWVGTDGGGLNRLDPGSRSFIRYAHDPDDPGSISHDLVRAIYEDRSGTLWVGTFGGGLCRFDPAANRFTPYRKGAPGVGLCGDSVMSVAEDSRGDIWIGTTDGLSRLDPKTGIFACYTQESGLPNSTAYGVLADAKNQIWISTNRGLARLDPETKKIKIYGPADGLQGNEFNGGSCYKTPSGEMFFGGTNGLNSFFPDAIEDNPFPPQVAITDFQIFNKSVPVGMPFNGRVVLSRSIVRTTAIDLRLSDRMISFSFAALHFAAPEKNRFAYRMDGLEGEWNDVGNRRFASYSNLKPGRYIFRVKAANNDGLWNEKGVSLAVRVIPPFWMAWEFQGLVLVGLFSAVFIAVRRRIRAIHARAARLEQKVASRTAELRDEIAVRHNAEVELDRRKKYLEAVLFNSTNAIVATDATSAIIEWSPGAKKIFGWRRDEVLGRNIDDVVIRPDHKSEAVHIQNEAVAGRIFNPFEAVRHRKDGTPINVIVTGAPILVGGDLRGTMAVYTDITGLKRAEEAAREANRAKSEFLANMSHEIRTPMNGIFGMTELALETDLSPQQKEYLEAVKTSAEMLMTIINDILDFSKIEAKKIDIESIPFRLGDTIHAIVSSVAFLAEKKGLEIAYDIPADVPDGLRGDPGRLRQVITNLLSNAIKFTAGGEVVVSVAAEERADDRLKLHVQVRDTGIGIPADKLKAVFDPFTQADSSTTRLYGGTGLGLAICSQLVALMNGRIWVESEAGRGSVFHFTAELGVEAAAGEERVRAPFDDLQNLTVLVVDDNATNRRILRDMLTHWGLAPTLAAGAAEAMTLIQEASREGRTYKLVLTDANMPEVDGFELAAQVKSLPGYGHVVIMMLSSSGFRGDSALCRKIGLSAYLTKPVKQSQLLDAIMLALGTRPEKAAEAPLITRHSLAPSHARYAILLAEDNIINQKLAVHILEKRGHKVTVANNGKEALEALERGSYDLVLMDVQMPEMDGFQATAAIRNKERGRDTRLPIVAMTAHAMAGDREKCLEAGMDEYVSKPLKPIDLFQTIDRAIEKSRCRPG